MELQQRPEPWMCMPLAFAMALDMPATDLLTGRRVSTAFSPGKISFAAPMAAFDAMVLKRNPPAVLPQ